MGWSKELQAFGVGLFNVIVDRATTYDEDALMLSCKECGGGSWDGEVISHGDQCFIARVESFLALAKKEDEQQDNDDI